MRVKITLMVVIVALISSTIAFWVPHIGFQPIAQTAIPRIFIITRLKETVHSIQEQTTYYVILGESYDMSEFAVDLADLEHLQEELSPFTDRMNVQAANLVILFEQADKIGLKSQEVISVHQQTLDSGSSETDPQTLQLLDELTILNAEFEEITDAIRDQTRQDIQEQVRRVGTSIIISSILILIGAISFGLFSTNKIVIQPMSKLVAYAQKLGDGDLSVRIRTDDQNEINKLGSTLNDMAAQLQQSMHEAAAQIDELRRTESNLEAANLELEQFAYVAAHDLKSPLRAIANLAGWLEEDLDEDALTDETRRYLQLLHSRIRRMEGLIDGLRSYSHSGRIDVKIETADTAKIVHELINVLTTPDKFVLNVQPKMPVFDTYRQNLEQVFFQLLSNAIKHHHLPTGKIDVTWQSDDDFYIFRIGDDGPGIAPEYHKKVFTIFQTLEARDKFESVGLGLPLVKKLVNSYGGQVFLELVEGNGTTVQFTWPKKNNVKPV